MSDVQFVGPFTRWDVVVDGNVVPFLDATPLEAGGVHLGLDRRFGVDLTHGEALKIVPFLADCIAVALGQSAHGMDGAPGPYQSVDVAPEVELCG